MASEIDELVELLETSEIRADVKHKGWEYILGLTATDAGIDSLLSPKFISFMLSCMKNYKKDDLNLPFVHKCFINISSNIEGALKLLSHNEDIVPDLLQSICDPTFEYIEPICYIINNLSSHGTLWSAAEVSDFPSELIETLTNVFISSDKNIRKKYRFLALVFANVTKQAVGRRYFLQNNRYLSDLFAVCASPSESIIGRLGVSLTVRNCCFETDSHQKLLKELNILPNLLLPLMGPEDYKEEEMEKFPIDCQYLEPTKEREEHPKIRRTLVQALCLLCYTEQGWNYLKEKGVYYIARELHNWEKDETVVEAIETLLVYLLVENYSAPSNEGKEIMLDAEYVMPSETDIIKDLPDFII